jgi:hypothetical protein
VAALRRPAVFLAAGFFARVDFDFGRADAFASVTASSCFFFLGTDQLRFRGNRNTNADQLGK